MARGAAGFALPCRRGASEEIMAWWFSFGDWFIAPRTVVADCGSVDQCRGWFRGLLYRRDDAACREDTAVENAFLLLRGPAAARDRFAGEVDDGVRAIDFFRPRSGCAIGGPGGESSLARGNVSGYAASEDDEVVAVAPERLGEER